MKRGQFALSTSFLVKLILGMAMFGLGIWLAFSIFKMGPTPPDTKCDFSACSPDDEFCIPDKIKIAENDVIFCAQIKNKLGKNAKFKLDVNSIKRVLPTVNTDVSTKITYVEKQDNDINDPVFELARGTVSGIKYMKFLIGVVNSEERYSANIQLLYDKDGDGDIDDVLTSRTVYIDIP
ncbi:hypothetical protein ACFL1H_03915 [Nanoarchaeota archaeon]